MKPQNKNAMFVEQHYEEPVDGKFKDVTDTAFKDLESNADEIPLYILVSCFCLWVFVVGQWLVPTTYGCLRLCLCSGGKYDQPLGGSYKNSLLLRFLE